MGDESPCGVGLNIVAHVPPFERKKGTWFTFYCFHAPLRCYFDIILFADYANCITSVSSSFNYSRDNAGTHRPISSSDNFPIFIIFSAVFLSVSFSISFA